MKRRVVLFFAGVLMLAGCVSDAQSISGMLEGQGLVDVTVSTGTESLPKFSARVDGTQCIVRGWRSGSGENWILEGYDSRWYTGSSLGSEWPPRGVSISRVAREYPTHVCR